MPNICIGLPSGWVRVVYQLAYPNGSLFYHGERNHTRAIMRKVFISYSTEDVIVSKLSQLLQQQGFSVQSSYNPRSNILDFTAYTAMQKSDLFIGVITTEGQWKRVWHEYQVAKSLNIPALLLAEDVFQNIKPEEHVVRFNKKNPNAAIQQVEAIMKPSQSDSSNTLVCGLLVAWHC